MVVILADDLGYGDLALLRPHDHRTPHLDALARGAPVHRFPLERGGGSPTRAGLMTGRYQQRCGVAEVLVAAGPRDRGLPENETTFASHLKKAGYRTGIFGKWHLGYQPRFNPTRFGFDEFRGYLSGNVDYLSHIDQADIADWWHGAKLEPEEGYTTELVTRHACVSSRRIARARSACTWRTRRCTRPTRGRTENRSAARERRQRRRRTPRFIRPCSNPWMRAWAA